MLSFKNYAWIAVFGGACLLAAPTSPARADIIILNDQGQGNPDENVLFQNAQTGTTITGATNQTGLLVDFINNAGLNFSASGGQATLEREGNTMQNPVPFGGNGGFTIQFQDSKLALEDLRFRLQLTDKDVSVKITAESVDINDNSKQFSETATFSGFQNEQQWFRIFGVNDQVVTTVTVETLGGDFIIQGEQFRVSGATREGGEQVTEIPEPGSAMLFLVCAAAAGAVGFRARRQRQ